MTTIMFMVPATLATIINYNHNLFIAQATGRHTRAYLFGASVATKRKVLLPARRRRRQRHTCRTGRSRRCPVFQLNLCQRYKTVFFVILAQVK